MKRLRVLALVLAGGKGERLYPLTVERTKAAVPFGGKYRLIDIVLSNLVNSDVTAIYVLTQYMAQSLLEHLQAGWAVQSLRGREFLIPVPAQMRLGETWYRGTADAIYQNMNLIDNHQPETVAVFGSDHVYRMNVQQMIAWHLSKKADMTVSAIPVPRSQAHQFGIIQADAEGRITGFVEKPGGPTPGIPGRPDYALASMGNYLFQPDFLRYVTTRDAMRQSEHDFGKSILPEIFKSHKVFAYDYSTNDFPGRLREAERGYWRDVGTILSYYETNIQLTHPEPFFNLYNREWPLRTAEFSDPPAKFISDERGEGGTAVCSIVSEGTVISGAHVVGSVIGRRVRLEKGAEITDSLIGDQVVIGPRCRIRRAIIDKDVVLPAGTEVGFHLEEDRKRYYVDPASGIVVIPKPTVDLKRP